MNAGDQSNFDAPPPKESGNRTFRAAAGILGGIILLSIAALAGYALLILPSQRVAEQQAATAKAVKSAQGAQALTVTAKAVQNAQAAQALTVTAQAVNFPTATLPMAPSQTPFIAQATATIAPPSPVTPDPATATVGAALTEAALAQLNVAATSTALPGTGLGDQYGAPGLVVAGMVLIAVIFLARRLRVRTAK